MDWCGDLGWCGELGKVDALGVCGKLGVGGDLDWGGELGGGGDLGWSISLLCPTGKECYELLQNKMILHILLTNKSY